MTNPRVAIYIRVSTTHQIDKDSLPMQRQDLAAYAKLILHSENYVVFEDAGYSGKNMDRPRFQEMMTQVRQGLFSHILVWKIDRISRNLLDFATMYAELKELGVVFVSKNEQFDTSTAMGEAMLKIILVFAELERNMTSERVTATMISRASNGQWNGGRIPYGYSYDAETMTFSINPDEASIAQNIFSLYLELKSLVEVVKVFNERNYRTRAGKVWSANAMRLILLNPWYVGSYRYNVSKEGNRAKKKNSSEWVVIPNHHEPLISSEVQDKAISLLRHNSKKVLASNLYESRNAVHLFGGLVFCETCNRQFYATTEYKNGLCIGRYYCPTRRLSNSCKNISVTDITLGAFVFNYLLNLLQCQKQRENITTPQKLSRFLLSGYEFSYIASISDDSLNSTLLCLHNLKDGEKVYNATVPKKKVTSNKTKISALKIERNKHERAIDRLTNLYLYSENAMSNADFITQKEKLLVAISDIDSQLDTLSKDELSGHITDEIFIYKASAFIISKKLAGRNYIDFTRLLKTTDINVLRQFVLSVIESISIKNGKISSITFRNGLVHRFIF